VNPPRYVTAFLIGSGKLVKKSKTLVNAFINFVATPKKSSPTSARLALNPSMALLYLPEADSVTLNLRCLLSSNLISVMSDFPVYLSLKIKHLDEQTGIFQTIAQVPVVFVVGLGYLKLIAKQE